MKSLNLPQELLESLGVLDWGYTEEPIPRSFEKYKAWTEEDNHGALKYLADYRREVRSDIRNVVPEFQSALVFLFSYQPAKKWMLENDHHEVAGYALGFEGEDYHEALKRRLNAIAEAIGITARISLDVHPVLERDLAHRAGLGWFGKNSMLINRKHGSYFIIGSLLLTEKLEAPPPVAVDVDHCGQCRACVDACPTDALNPETRTLIADKCISTFTIELMKDAEAPAGFEKSRGEFFGCDICQDVCPWNKKPLTRVTSALKLQERFTFLKDLFYDNPRSKLRELIANESVRGWRKKLLGTAFDRPGKEGWLKNLKFVFLILALATACASPKTRVSKILDKKFEPLMKDERVIAESDQGEDHVKNYAFFITQQGIKHLDVKDLTRWHELRIKMARSERAYCAGLITGKISENTAFAAFANLQDNELDEVGDLMVKGAFRKLNNEGSPKAHVSDVKAGMVEIMNSLQPDIKTRFQKVFGELATVDEKEACWATLLLYESISTLPETKRAIMLKGLVGI